MQKKEEIQRKIEALEKKLKEKKGDKQQQQSCEQVLSSFTWTSTNSYYLQVLLRVQYIMFDSPFFLKGYFSLLYRVH